MSVLRQGNFLGNMRVDAPHLRSIESAVAADFDVLAGRIVAGAKPLVIRGFTLSNFAAGTPATSVQLNVANAILVNIAASESGSFFWVPANRSAEILDSATNSKIYGSFAANQINYIGLDLVRKADSSTSDLIQVLDSNTLLEEPRTAPLARTLDYKIVISTVPFSAQPNLVPIAKIKTDGSNQVAALSTDVEDARNLAFRLGSGGDFPNRNYAYAFVDGRKEFNTVTGASVGQFSGGDKTISSQKDWMDAVMTRIWEIGGGENWYSPTADRNMQLGRDPGSVFASNGENFEFVAGDLHWRGLSVVFENSNGTAVFKNTITDQTVDSAGLTDIIAGECIYVDLDRTQTASLSAKKAALNALGTPSIPGSRVVIAWCVATGVVMTRNSPYPVNTTILPATTTAIGGVRLNSTPATPGTPTVVTLKAGNGAEIGSVTYAVTSGSVLTLTSDAAGTARALNVVGDADESGIVISHNHATTVSPSLSILNSSNGNNAIYAESNNSLAVIQGKNFGSGNGLFGFVFAGAGAGVLGQNGGAGPALKADNTGTGYGLEASAVANHSVIATQNDVTYDAVNATHTDNFGVAIRGTSDDGTGVRGVSANHRGVEGSSTDGIGVHAFSANSNALYATNNSTTDSVGYFINAKNGTAHALEATINSTNAAAVTALVSNTGAGSAIKGTSVSAYGVWSVSGSSTAGARLENTSSGSGVDILNTGTGAGARVQCTTPNANAIRIIGSSGNNIVYSPAIAAKKILSPYDFIYETSPGTLTPGIITAPSLPRHSFAFATASDTGVFYNRFYLPMNAVIDSVNLRVTHSGTTGSGLAAHIVIQKTAKNATGFTNTDVFNATSFIMPLSAGASSQTFTPAMNATASNRTVTSFDDGFAVFISASISASVAATFELVWVEINYSLSDLLPV